mgnify:CR=1 FL=1
MTCYILIVILFYLIAEDQLQFRVDQTEMPQANSSTGELVSGTEVRQAFTADADKLLSLSLLTATYDRTNTALLNVAVVDKNGVEAGQVTVSSSWLTNGVSEITFLTPVEITPRATYELIITSPDGTGGNTIALMYGNSMALPRGEMPLDIPAEEQIQVNGVSQEGKLCVRLTTQKTLWIGQIYWHLAIGIGIALIAYGWYTLRRIQQGRVTVVLRVAAAFQRYKFLIKQLVLRDFKTKYKRSVLGILWSFLNPLLTMTVQYIVFSTIFRSDIPNFALYLLTGIVCFNFFSEASSMALMSIVGNAPLITKVYVPKYIYPLSRVLSSSINLLFSLIPLLAVMLITGAPLRPALLLLPFGLICLFLFSLGIGLLLSTAMVFFRDTQFLWGVVSMLWMYLSPIIYPESIIPVKFLTLYKCNPLYHIIRFIRIILMDGISPEPKAYGLCIIASAVPLIIGAVVFKKNQDKFVLNL